MSLDLWGNILRANIFLKNEKKLQILTKIWTSVLLRTELRYNLNNTVSIILIIIIWLLKQITNVNMKKLCSDKGYQLSSLVYDSSELSWTILWIFSSKLSFDMFVASNWLDDNLDISIDEANPNFWPDERAFVSFSNAFCIRFVISVTFFTVMLEHLKTCIDMNSENCKHHAKFKRTHHKSSTSIGTRQHHLQTPPPRHTHTETHLIFK